MASDIAMMIFLCFLACMAVVLVARIPDAPGHYTDPTWIVAAMAAVLMVQGFYVTRWLCQMFRVFEETLRRMRQLIEELTHDR